MTRLKLTGQQRTRVCPTCSNSFTYLVAPGRDRKHCGPRCRAVHKKELLKAAFDAAPNCKVPGCTRRVQRVGHGLCEACYCQYRRVGSYERIQHSPRIYKKHRHTAGYLILWKPGHPLSNAASMVAEHRYVLYESIGPGPHPCHWCARQVEWRDAQVDHLNEVKDDNAVSNLAFSCALCNQQRGQAIQFLRRIPECKRADALRHVGRPAVERGQTHSTNCT